MEQRHWLKKGIAALMLVAVMLVSTFFINVIMPARAATSAKTEQEDLKIAVLSDTHYLSPDLIKDTEDFTRHLNSDRKMFAESDAFLTAMLDIIKKDEPEILLISGDLTKDGEKEGHEAFAEKLKTFRDTEMPDLHIYITPGNHDLNNSNAMNFNTADGKAVPAGRTTQQIYKEIYSELTYSDKTVIATFEPKAGKQGGGLSYVARPKNGFTVISMDSARYSADNTDSGTDSQETSGAIGKDLEEWILKQIAIAKNKGDTVIGLQHHGYIPHFGMEPDLLPMYLVNDYERLSTAFADAGMQYVFTGHMHANDIASLTTDKGNTLYDIETGSLVTYPSPSRTVTISRKIENGKVSETFDVKTNSGVGPITFTNPMTKTEQTIEDITAYGEQHGFSNDMLTTTVNGFLHGIYGQIEQAGGAKKAVEKLLNDLLGDSLPIKDITVEKLIDVGLPLLLPDGSNAEEIYYDGEEGGIVIKKQVSFIKLQIVVPNKALKQTIGVLFDKIDDEVLAKPETMDNPVKNLVTTLTAIPVSQDGETTKTLLDFANFIYQSHLGGLDRGAQPRWVRDAVSNLEDGSLFETVLEAVIKNVTDIFKQAMDNLPFADILGAAEYNKTEKCLVGLENRTPLIRALDDTSASTLGLLFGAVMKWPEGGTGFVMPAGKNPEVAYSTGEALDVLCPLLGIDIDTFLAELINGTPADADAGVEATEGLLTEELKGQLNGFLLGVVKSMGTDDNYPADNDTSISYQWKLLTNRAALDSAIADAEKIDLSKYTQATASKVTEALSAAKELSPLTDQSEIDRVSGSLQQALSALELVSDNTGNTGNNGNLGLWIPLGIVLGLVVCGGIVGIVVYSRKKKAK